MVHFPGFARARLWIHRAVRGFYPRGFPHSEIPGSMPACGSPRLIAACHVLHRLLLPRHPPCALSSLTIKFTRHTAASPQLSAISRQLSAKPPHAGKFHGPNPCSSHAHALLCSPLWLLFFDHRVHRGICAAYTSRFLSGTHKNYSLVDCPIYSVVKYRPHHPPGRTCLVGTAC